MFKDSEELYKSDKVHDSYPCFLVNGLTKSGYSKEQKM